MQRREFLKLLGGAATGSAADQIRTGHQFEDRSGTRSRYSADHALAGGRGDRI